MNEREGGLYGFSFRPTQPIGEDHRVFGLFLERQKRPRDKRVRLAFVPGEEIVDGWDFSRTEYVGMIENLVEVHVEFGAVVVLCEADAFFLRLEEKIIFARLRIVREVTKRITDVRRKISLANVQDRR